MASQLTPSTHSRFSPSGSKRWISCPGSIAFVESLNLPHRDSEYAAEGTACHELAAHCLQKHILDASAFVDEIFYRDIKTTWEMCSATNEYVAYILSFIHPGAILEVEQRVEMDDLQHGTGGTSDAFIWSTEEFHCFDLKYGQGVPVEVTENYQLMLYAAGRIRELHLSGKINASKLKRICLHIIQPRAPHSDGPCRSWDVSVDRLRTHWIDAKEAIKLACSKNPPLNPGAEQCKWCDGAPVCRSLAEFNMKTAMLDFADLAEPEIDLIQANKLSNDELAYVLTHSDTLENWIKSVVSFAQYQLERQIKIPGYKLVRGRSNRSWANNSDEQILQWLEDRGVDTSEAYTKPKLRSPSQIEQIVGKKAFKELDDYVIKPLGKVTIATTSDKRDEVFINNTPQNDFAPFATGDLDE